MGRVFLGQSPGGRLVAVKLIRPDLADDPGFRRRFAQEVSAARRVSGIFTAPVVDADPDGPQPWLVTAYVAGPSLTDAVEARGPMPVESVLTLAAGLAEGLGAVHAAGVVHRDLKPANVLLASDGPRIIDFGISHATDSAWLTNAGGVVVGSPGFMSPEQAEGHDVGPATDIFSLGGVLAYAATGEPPFGAGSASALLYRVVYGTAATGHVPAPLRRLVERCLAKDPADRPTTDELLAELGYAEPKEDWLSWPAAAVRPAVELPATRLDHVARWEPGDHHSNSGNGAVLAGSSPSQPGRWAGGNPVDGYPVDGYPVDGYPVDGYPVDGYPANGGVANHARPDGYPANGGRLDGYPAHADVANRARPDGYPADDVPAALTEPVTATRSARHSPSSALIGAAVAALLAAGAAGAVAYVVASHHDDAAARAGALPPQAQVGADNRSKPSQGAPQVTPPGPRAVVDSYFTAINHREWQRVWRLGGDNSNLSYRKMIDGYSNTDREAIRAIDVSGDHAIVRVRAYETDGGFQVYQMDFVIQDGVIVHATRQLLTAEPNSAAAQPYSAAAQPDGTATKPDGRALGT
jgi:hypothetical protein